MLLIKKDFIFHVKVKRSGPFHRASFLKYITRMMILKNILTKNFRYHEENELLCNYLIVSVVIFKYCYNFFLSMKIAIVCTIMVLFYKYYLAYIKN